MTNPATSTWFEGESVWDYRGELPVVIHFTNTIPADMMFISYNPSKDATRFIDRLGPMLKVKRWLVLPP